jgi:hypothetical protein
MQEESRNNYYFIIDYFNVFVGLPLTCKSTMSLKRTNVRELKNDKEFEVINLTNKSITIKSDRLEVDINHKVLNNSI